MTPPLLHIGFHKTGTSWFQSCFYPAVKNGHFVSRKEARSELIAPRALSFDAEAARSTLIAAAGERRLLICEENLSGYIHNGGLGGLLSAEMARRLHASFPEAQIIVFLRSQERMAAAAYAQYVRGGGTYRLERYLGLKRSAGVTKYWYKAPAFSFDHLDYQPLLEHYARLFGRSAVHAYVYEEMAADPPGFVRRFAGEHGLEVEWDQVGFERVNASLSPRQLRLLRRLNLLTARSVPNKRHIADLEDWYDRRWRWLRRLERLPMPQRADRPMIDAGILEDIRRRFAQVNARLARDWKLPLERYDWPLA